MCGLLLLLVPAAASASDAQSAAAVSSSPLLARLRATAPPTQSWLLAPDRMLPAGTAAGSPIVAAADLSEFDEEDRDVVNVRRAVMYSLVVPGAGQWYAGSRARAGIFLAADAVAWGAWGYFRTIGAIKKNDHRNFAQVHAGVDPENKDNTFYRTITFYDSRDSYNENRSELSAPYPNADTWYWQWDSPESRQEYRDIRNQSNEAYNRAKFALGAVVLTRIVAAIDAWRFARMVNRSARMEMARWKVRLKGKPSLEHPSLMVILSKRF